MTRVLRRGLPTWFSLATLLVLVPLAALGQTPTATSTASSIPTPSASASAATRTPTSTPIATPVLPDRSVASTYRGSWVAGSAAGAASLSWSQSGDALEGVLVLQNHPCLELAQVTARLSGDTISATLRSSTSPATGSARWTVGGIQLAGTYQLVSGCDRSANGLLSLTAQVVVTPRGTPTATITRPLQSPTPTATPSASPTPRLAGDCNGDGTVVVNEILTLVSIGISTRPLVVCRDADRNGDGAITVDEIIAAVLAALHGRSGTPPPPILDACLDGSVGTCLCRGSICCLAGSCGVGEPCVDSSDCGLPLVCQTASDGSRRCAEDGSIVVPPPL